MKAYVHGIVMVVLGIFAILCVYSIFVNANTKRELENAMSIDVDAAVEQAMEGCNYSLKDLDEFKYEFLQSVCLSQTGDGLIQVDFNHIDYEEGLLAVTVTRKFTYPIGTEGKVVCRKVVIFEEEVADDGLCVVTFEDENGTPYRAFKGRFGEKMSSFFDTATLPCRNWINKATGQLFSDEMTATCDMTFVPADDIDGGV